MLLLYQSVFTLPYLESKHLTRRLIKYSESQWSLCLILDSLISKSIEYYATLCESTLQSKCLPEQELTSLPLMSRNIISAVVQYNGAFVFCGEEGLSVKDRKGEREGENEQNKKSEFDLCFATEFLAVLDSDTLLN